MNIGIIIIFHNNATDIDKLLLKGLLDLKDSAQLCLINNASKDNTLEKLQELNDASELVYTILDIKQNKGNVAAIKAGARYLFNQKELRYVGFINIEDGNSMQFLFEFLSATKNYKDLIVQYNIDHLKNNKMQRTLFKNIFSIVDCLSKQHLFINKLIS